MKNNTIYMIAVIIVVVVIIAVTMYATINGEKNEKDNIIDKAVILIFDYDSNPADVEELEITDKEEIAKLKRIYSELPSPEQEINIDIRDDIIIEFDNGNKIYIDLNDEVYCYIEDAETGEVRLVFITRELFEYLKDII